MNNIPDPCDHCDIKEVLSFVHKLDTRVSVLETRMSNQDEHLETIDGMVRDTKHQIEELNRNLSSHAAREDQNRIALLSRINWTLISVLASILGYLAIQVYEKLFP